MSTSPALVRIPRGHGMGPARHVEVFSRRAMLHGGSMGTSSAGGRSSLATLLAEPDFSLASFLLSVLGEGSFLALLGFLEQHAPDPVTTRITHLARVDEARHVAFGVAHLEHQSALDPSLRGALRAAIERRHDALVDTAGLNADVFARWSCSPRAAGRRRRSPAGTPRSRSSTEPWTTDAGASPGWASRPTRRPSSRLHTRNFT